MCAHSGLTVMIAIVMKALVMMGMMMVSAMVSTRST
jgi:hypothetical protein